MTRQSWIMVVGVLAFSVAVVALGVTAGSANVPPPLARVATTPTPAVPATTAAAASPDPVSDPSQLTDPNDAAIAAAFAEQTKKRDAWFMDQRIGTRKAIPKGAWSRSIGQAEELVVEELVETDPLTWSEVGPTPLQDAVFSWRYGGSVPYAGRVTAIATHPTDSKTAYVGTAMGGVWKTTDDGQSWTPLFDGWAQAGARGPTVAIGAIAVDPSAPGTVYVGTGEANYTGGYFGTGLYRSGDGGETWARIGGSLFDECGFSAIVVKPGDSRTIVLGVVSTLASWPNSSGRVATQCSASGVYRTINGGAAAADWTKVLAGQVNKVVMAPNDSKVLYAGIYASGVYKSGTSGETWAKVTNLAPAPTTIARVDVAAVAAGQLSTQQAVYVAIASADGDLPRLYYSTDSGGRWQATSTAFIGDPAVEYGFCGKAGNGQCDTYDLALAADPSDPRHAFVAGVYLNGVSSLVPRRIGYAVPSSSSTSCPLSVKLPATTTCIHVDYHALVFDAAGRLWVGNDGGVYRTANPRATTPTFSNLNKGINAMMYYPGLTGRLGTQLLAGAQDNGTTRIASGSATGSLVGGGDGAYAAAVGTGGLVLTSSQNLAIAKVTDGVSCNYDDATYGLTEAGKLQAPFIAPLVASPANTSHAYAGTSYVWRTVNANAACGTFTRWTKVSQRFTWTDSNNNLRGNVNAIAPAKAGDLVYMGTRYSGKVYVGTVSATWTTAATTWADRSTGIPDRAVTDFWVSPTNSQTAYATVSGFGSGHVFKTTNAGVGWTNISGNLPNSPANAVVVDTRTTPATIYVGMDVGVFWSRDEGVTWQDTSLGLPRTVVHDLLLDTTADRLVAATFGRGLWKAVPIGSALAGPPNDAFASARVVSGLPFAVAGIDTAQAGTESGENLDPTCSEFMGTTVWFRYTPSANVTVTADTGGSTVGFDTVLRAFRGTTLQTLTEVACDDDGVAQGGASRISSLALTAGQTYYFQAGGWTQTAAGVAESGMLNFSLVARGSVNDAFGSATAISTLPYAASGLDTSLATTEVNEPLDPTCADFVGKTVWYRLTPASNVTITADSAGSSTGFDTVLVVYQGTTLTGLSPVACDDDSAVYPNNGGASRITSVNLTGGQTYYVQVGGWRQTVDGTASSGTLSLSIKVAGLANDAFATATADGAFPFTVTGVDTSQATTEQGEPLDPSCTDFVGKTLWYRLTPAANATITADTAGSSSGFDTVLVLYQGATMAGLTPVACDDDGVGSGGASRIVTANLTGGQTYYLQVGGWKGATGTPSSGSLRLRIGTIDAFGSAAEIGKLPFAATGIDTAQATTEAGENLDPSCSGTGTVGGTLWFRYTPPANVTVTADTAGSSTGFDTVLTAYRGTVLGALVEVGCDDDGIAGSGASRIASLALTGGQTYFFQAAGWQASGGTPSSGTLVFNLVSN